MKWPKLSREAKKRIHWQLLHVALTEYVIGEEEKKDE